MLKWTKYNKGLKKHYTNTRNHRLSCTDSIWAINMSWLDNLLHMVTDQNIAFLIPDWCRATVKKSNGINADFIEDTIKNN
jgi:hypothetical protein